MRKFLMVLLFTLAGTALARMTEFESTGIDTGEPTALEKARQSSSASGYFTLTAGDVDFVVTVEASPADQELVQVVKSTARHQALEQVGLSDTQFSPLSAHVSLQCRLTPY
ncbi:MAG TPA: hypothetical protein VFD39_04495 [Trueperaceae bacterium]|nr:hypothetical protein [Trueperaceae bacterium]